MITLYSHPLVPAWVAAGKFPEADETELAALARAWDKLGHQTTAAEADVRTAANLLFHSWAGAASGSAQTQVSTVERWLDSISSSAQVMSSGTATAAAYVQHAKTAINNVLRALGITTTKAILAGIVNPLDALRLSSEVNAAQAWARAQITQYYDALTAMLGGIGFNAVVQPDIRGVAGSGGQASGSASGSASAGASPTGGAGAAGGATPQPGGSATPAKPVDVYPDGRPINPDDVAQTHPDGSVVLKDGTVIPGSTGTQAQGAATGQPVTDPAGMYGLPAGTAPAAGATATIALPWGTGLVPPKNPLPTEEKVGGDENSKAVESANDKQEKQNQTVPTGLDEAIRRGEVVPTPTQEKTDQVNQDIQSGGGQAQDNRNGVRAANQEMQAGTKQVSYDSVPESMKSAPTGYQPSGHQHADPAPAGGQGSGAQNTGGGGGGGGESQPGSSSGIPAAGTSPTVGQPSGDPGGSSGSGSTHGGIFGDDGTGGSGGNGGTGTSTGQATSTGLGGGSYVGTSGGQGAGSSVGASGGQAGSYPTGPAATPSTSGGTTGPATPSPGTGAAGVSAPVAPMPGMNTMAGAPLPSAPPPATPTYGSTPLMGGGLGSGGAAPSVGVGGLGSPAPAAPLPAAGGGIPAAPASAGLGGAQLSPGMAANQAVAANPAAAGGGLPPAPAAAAPGSGPGAAVGQPGAIGPQSSQPPAAATGTQSGAGGPLGAGGTSGAGRADAGASAAETAVTLGGVIATLGLVGAAAMHFSYLWGDLRANPIVVAKNGQLLPTQFGPSDQQTAALPAGLSAAYQKVLLPGEAEALLDGQITSLRGIVHPLDQVARLRTPGELYQALGLGFPIRGRSGADSLAFARDAESIEVLRFAGLRLEDLITPIEADVVLPPDTVPLPLVRRHARPWTGTGEAPGSTSTDPIDEHEVLGYAAVPLPHLAEIWRLHADGTAEYVSTYNARNASWVGSTAPARRDTGNRVDNGPFATLTDGNVFEIVPLSDRFTILVARGPAPEGFLPSQDGTARIQVANEHLASVTGVTTIGLWQGLPVQLLARSGGSLLVDYAGDDQAAAAGAGFMQVNQGQWQARWVPGDEVADVQTLERVYPLPARSREPEPSSTPRTPEAVPADAGRFDRAGV